MRFIHTIKGIMEDSPAQIVLITLCCFSVQGSCCTFAPPIFPRGSCTLHQSTVHSWGRPPHHSTCSSLPQSNPRDSCGWFSPCLRTLCLLPTSQRTPPRSS